MSGPSESSSRSPEEIRAELVSVARRIEALETLTPEIRSRMVTLLDELASLLDQGRTEAEIGHVSRLSLRLRALVDEAQDQESLAGRSRELLEQAAAHAEADAPVLTNVVRRLIDVLADIGI